MAFCFIHQGYGIGLFGSFHCIGMCGPIALSLPIHQFQQAEKLVSVLLYNIGKSISYAIFGMLFGLIGSTFTFFRKYNNFYLFFRCFYCFCFF